MTIAAASVTIQDAAPPPTTLIDTGTAFMVGLSDRGTAGSGAVPIKASDAIYSLGDWITKQGALQSYNGNEYAAVESFFAEGGSRLFFSRYVGPSAVKASGAVPASSSKFTATAKAAGSYGNSLKVSVSSSVITVKDGSTVVETSPTLASVADAQSWATTYSTYIDITPIGSGALTDSADVSLTSGADDRTNISDTERQAALDRFGKDLGPGQVLAPGDTRTAMHQKLAQHALDRNRFALGDCPDSATASTAAAPGATARALGRDLARHIQLLGDWLIAPGTSTGTTRIVPPSGVHAGLCARNDAGGHPNRAVAGRDSYSRFALDTHYSRTDADRQTFATNGITPYVVDGDVVQPYDDITPVNGDTDPEWLEASSNRFVMRVVQDALAVAKAFMFTPVSGSADFGAYGGALTAMLLGWKSEGALYGDTPADAFRVETGPAVNTSTTIAAKKLVAALSLKVSPNVRNASVLITNTPITEAL